MKNLTRIAALTTTTAVVLFCTDFAARSQNCQQQSFAIGDVFVSLGGDPIQWWRGGAHVPLPSFGFAANGSAFDAYGNLFVTGGAGGGFTPQNVAEYDNTGGFLCFTGKPYEAGIPNSIVLDANGNFYVGYIGGGLYKFTASGDYLNSWDTTMSFTWIDLASDGKTIYFTSSDTRVRRLDTSTGSLTSAVDLATLGYTSAVLMGIKCLPDGGVLVADHSGSGSIYRFTSSFSLAQQYSVSGESWIPLALDPDGVSFWGGTQSANVYKFNLANGSFTGFNTSPNPAAPVTGLSVYSAPNGLLLTSPQLTSSTFSFAASGNPGATYNVHASTDLVTWTTVGSPITLNSAFTDSSVNGVQQRCYRLSPTSGTICPKNIIGFARLSVPAGTWKMIAVQFDCCPDNTLPSLFGTSLPNGAIVSVWNGSSWVNYTWSQSGWSPNASGVTILPGQGSFIYNPSAASITVSFMGMVRKEQLLNNVTAGQNPYSYLAPRAGSLTSSLSYQPTVGDEVYQYTGSGYALYTYRSTGWTPSEPWIAVGESFLIQTTTPQLWDSCLQIPCP